MLRRPRETVIEHQFVLKERENNEEIYTNKFSYDFDPYIL